jgi:hypothetical protein
MATQAAAKIPPRGRTLPRMGDPQPALTAGTIERPPVTPNPILEREDPTSFPRERMPEPLYDSITPRIVTEADIDELLTWGLPRFRRRYPRATPELIRPVLFAGTRGGRFRYLRTSVAQGLFEAIRTPWEPEIAVVDVFVVGRARQRDNLTDEDKVLWKAQEQEVPNIIVAAYLWAMDIKAVSFQVAQSTGINYQRVIEQVQKRIGVAPDIRAEAWIWTRKGT